MADADKYEKTRDINPAAFLLSQDEHDFIYRAYYAASLTSLQYLAVDFGKKKTDDARFRKIVKEEVLKLFEEKQVDMDRILSISQRLDTCKWWSLVLRQIYEWSELHPNKADVYAFDLVSNVDGIPLRSVRTDEDAAVFKTYDAREQARLLHIPDSALYVSYTELFMIALLRDICNVPAVESEILKEQGFMRIPNNPVANALYTIGSDALKRSMLKPAYDADNQLITERIIKGSNGVNVYLTDDGNTDLIFKSNNVDMMYTLLLHKALTEHSKDMVLSLDEFMEIRGLKDRQTADEQARAALAILKKMEIELQYKKGKTITGFRRTNILQSIAWEEDSSKRRGRKIRYGAVFSDDIYSAATSSAAFAQMTGYELLPMQIMRISGKKPHAYRFARLFNAHLRRNVSNPYQQPYDLTVKYLLNNSTLPRYEDLKDKAQVKQLIIKPFDDSFEYLVEQGIIKEFTYHHRKDGDKIQELTDDERDRLLYDYDLFSSLLVRIVWAKQPDYNHLKEQKAKRLAEANKPKRKRGRPRKQPIT